MMKSKLQPINKMGMKKKIELLETKPNKVRPTAEKKPLLKSELIVQLKEVNQKYTILQGEFENQIQTIKTLEGKVSVLQKRKQESHISGKCQESQTFSDVLQISCNRCTSWQHARKS